MSDYSSIDAGEVVAGYAVIEPLGVRQESGHRLLLAVHPRTQNHVVLKETDPNSYAREEMIYASGLAHDNILIPDQLFEAQQSYYVQTAYQSRGDLGAQLRKGMHIQSLIKAIKDTARALHHLHEAGFVHGDIKPENILFSDNNQVLLSDFGNARIIGQSCRDENGRVTGTPQYMSPEQAAGREVDARADLYSLGILLYQALTGDLPYRADSPIELGMKHLQEPIPKLTGYLQHFQNLIDLSLAKRRDQRIASGEEFVEQLDVARKLVLDVEASIRTDDISTQEISAAASDALSSLSANTRSERNRLKRRRRRRNRLAAAAGVLLIATGVLGFLAYEGKLEIPNELAEALGLVEDPVLQAAWEDAEALHADPNQGLSTIVSAYRNVLAIEPQHQQASQVISSLTSEWVSEIETSIEYGELETARLKLNEAENIFPDEPSWGRLRTTLQNRSRAERIVTSTQGLLASHGISDLPSATAAIQSYQEVLRLAPGHVEASRALAELAEFYAQQASEAAGAGRVKEAITLLERATAADPLMSELDVVRGQISQAASSQEALNELLAQANTLRAEGRLLSPAGNNAAELYLQILATDINNQPATQFLNEIRRDVSADIEAMLGRADTAGARSLIQQAADAGMRTEFLNELRGRVEDEENRQAEVVRLFARAQQLVADGYLSAPTSTNAVETLRTLLQIDANHQPARALLLEIAQRLYEVATEAKRWQLDAQAASYLALAVELAPGEESWRTLQSEWQPDASGGNADSATAESPTPTVTAEPAPPAGDPLAGSGQE